MSDLTETSGPAAAPTLAQLTGARRFSERHIGPDDEQVTEMLKTLGVSSLEALMEDAVPGRIAAPGLDLPPAASERATATELREIAAQNNPLVPMIGLGYHGTITPPVIRRNVLEDPAWYTAYTPYQPEISQGRLEALLNFQTMVADLTGLRTSNASLLDEGTAAAEAMTLVRRAHKGGGPFVLDADALPQTIEVVRTRARAMGIEVVVADLADGLPEGDLSGVLVQYPGASGRVLDPRPVIEAAHERGGLAVVAADLLALTLLESPGELGADVAVGSSQRFGVPLFYGGPHAGFMSVRAGLERHLPGRLVGVSVDSAGRPAYRLSLQTREQHIRRDRATSNICTAQVLLAVVASMYAVYHGPAGLTAIAEATHAHAAALADALEAGGVDVVHPEFFDTVLARVPGRAAEVVAAAREAGVHLRHVDDDHVGVDLLRGGRRGVVDMVLGAFGIETDHRDRCAERPAAGPAATRDRVPDPRGLQHPPLGDLDAALPASALRARLRAGPRHDPAGLVHHEAQRDDRDGAGEPARASRTCTRSRPPRTPAATSVSSPSWSRGWRRSPATTRSPSSPNAGSQGELAGLLAIRGYHRANGEGERNVCLIPSSAHGTNAASAVMAGMKVVVVKSAADGSVDMDDLRAQCEAHRDDLAAIMVTYPSTHGAYEDTISDLCATVHDAGGQVYVDGANLNALLGYAKPGEFGGDVSHLNLHKTFCIPHGGGGPGVGPVGVRRHLAAYLPSHPMHPESGRREGIGPISAAPYGSAGILPISWAYVRMMGAEGLTQATAVAVLAANYVAERLQGHFPVLYRGHNDRVAHECILDLRGLTKAAGLSVDDVAKRLIDYGFHAPTMSFPVAGTLMVEPTESEDLGELDRFCEAMIAIRGEIDKVASGEWDAKRSPLGGAPHTADALTRDLGYDLATAVFPTGFDPDKYWPPVGRIDQAYGDRNLVCACPPPEAFE